MIDTVDRTYREDKALRAYSDAPPPRHKAIAKAAPLYYLDCWEQKGNKEYPRQCGYDSFKDVKFKHDGRDFLIRYLIFGSKVFEYPERILSKTEKYLHAQRKMHVGKIYSAIAASMRANHYLDNGKILKHAKFIVNCLSIYNTEFYGYKKGKIEYYKKMDREKAKRIINFVLLKRDALFGRDNYYLPYHEGWLYGICQFHYLDGLPLNYNPATVNTVIYPKT